MKDRAGHSGNVIEISHSSAASVGMAGLDALTSFMLPLTS